MDEQTTTGPTSGTGTAGATDGTGQHTGHDSRLRRSDPFLPAFLGLLGNVLVVSVINFTVWFAITFYVYLQTRSVFATGLIAGTRCAWWRRPSGRRSACPSPARRCSRCSSGARRR